MRPVKREDHNFEYLGPTDEIGDLPGRVEEDCFVSHWEPSDQEKQLIAEGGVIELSVFAKPIPPVAVNVTTRHPE